MAQLKFPRVHLLFLIEFSQTKRDIRPKVDIEAPKQASEPKPKLDCAQLYFPRSFLV